VPQPTACPRFLIKRRTILPSALGINRGVSGMDSPDLGRVYVCCF